MTNQEPTYTLEEGKYLVDLARKSIIHVLTFGKILPIPKEVPEKLKKDSGVFVTLNKRNEFGKKGLRGCIGFATPIYPLVKATIEAAKSAAVSDTRFPIVELEEMHDIEIEISILTPPKKMNVTDPMEYLSRIMIGRDGLIVKQGGRNGLLLPQVPVEWEWDLEEFLEHTCQKAGLPKNCWQDSRTEVHKFSGIIFHETLIGGEVVEKEFVDE